MPDGALFDTITNGKGLMPRYRYPIQPHDRWAIIAYVRSLAEGRDGGGRRSESPRPDRPRARRRARARRGRCACGSALNDHAYHPPIHSADSPSRCRATRGSRTSRKAAEEKAKAKKYEPPAYRTFPVVGSRVAVWIVAELHLMFAAFVLAVPMFAFIIELIGYFNGDKRYDRLAYEFTKLLSTSFSFTASFGGFLTFLLIMLYPAFMNYLMEVFSPTFLPYVGLFFFEAGFLYSYYYGWGKFHPLVHLGLGLGINVVGTVIMAIANAWASFMMTPQGVSDSRRAHRSLRRLRQLLVDADQHPPLHRQHRLRRLGRRGLRGLEVPRTPTTDEERAHYDWMGYIGNFVAISAFLPLPFAGYYLAQGDLRLQPGARHHDDGRRVLVAVHHPGRADRQSLPRRQLLPVARHGPRRGRAGRTRST